MLFEERLRQVDQQLKTRGVRLHLRPLACFKAVHGSIADEQERKRLFEVIHRWYWEIYGQRIAWDGVVATYPVVIRGELFSSDANVLGTHETIEYKTVIKGLPDELRDQLDDHDFQTASERMQQANLNWAHLYNLSIDSAMLPCEAQAMTDKALLDLENAGSSLADKHDLDTGMFQAQQATEKFLKSALLYEGHVGSVEKYRHHLSKAYTELVKLAPRYSALPKPTATLASLVPDMQLRYKASSASVDEAVTGYHAALHVCAMLARIWVMDMKRGSKRSAFKETCFYEAPIGNHAYCKSATGESAVLLCFRPVCDRYVTYEVALKQRESALYLQIDDPGLDSKLRKELTWYLLNCRRKVPPSESNVRIVKGKEGNYTVSAMKLSRPS